MPFYCKHGHDQLASLCAMCEEEITGAVTPASMEAFMVCQSWSMALDTMACTDSEVLEKKDITYFF